MYLSDLKNVFVRIEKCRAACGQPTLSSLENVSKSALTSCRPDSPQRLLEEEEEESDWWNMSRLGSRLEAGWKPARPNPPSLSSPITLPVLSPLRLLWPYWPEQLQAVGSSPPPLPPPPSIACSRGKKGPFLASLPVFTNDAKLHCIDGGTDDIFIRPVSDRWLSLSQTDSLTH